MDGSISADRGVHDGTGRLAGHRDSGEHVAHLGGKGGGDPLFPAGVILEGAGDAPGAGLDGPLDAGNPRISSFVPAPTESCRRHGRFVVQEEPPGHYNVDDGVGAPNNDAESRPTSPLDAPFLGKIETAIVNRVTELSGDPMADLFAEQSVAASVQSVVRQSTTTAGTLRRNPNITYGQGTLTRLFHGVPMVTVGVKAVASGHEYGGPTVVVQCNADGMKSGVTAARIVKSAGINFGGWVCVVWCPPHRRAAVLAAPVGSGDELYYLVCLCNMAANGAISVGANVEAAMTSVAGHGGPTGIHPVYGRQDSPFYKWYRTLTPRPNGWRTSAGARITVVGGSPE